MKIQKVRVEMRLPKDLVDAVDEAAARVGLRRNAFFGIAVSLLAVQLAAKFLPGAKRDHLFERMEKQIQDRLDVARKAL